MPYSQAMTTVRDRSMVSAIKTAISLFVSFIVYSSSSGYLL